MRLGLKPIRTILSDDVPIAYRPGRQVTEPVFWGSGDVLAGALVEGRLRCAFSIQSGLQQPDHPTTEQEADDCKTWRADAMSNLYDCALDILAGLGIDPADLARYSKDRP